MVQKFCAPLRVRKQPEILLHFGHSDRALAQIVCEGDAKISHEAQHLGRMFAHPAQQVDCRHLFDVPAPSTFSFGFWIFGSTLGQDGAVARKNLPDLFWSQRRCARPRCRAGVASGD